MAKHKRHRMSTKLWVRVTYDGSNLEVYTASTEALLGSASACYASASFKMTGGMIGFAGARGYFYVDDVELRAHRDTTGNGTPDTWFTEFKDDFTVDANGYADDDPLITHPRLQSARFTSNGTANAGPALNEVGTRACSTMRRSGQGVG